MKEESFANTGDGLDLYCFFDRLPIADIIKEKPYGFLLFCCFTKPNRNTCEPNTDTLAASFP
jgi:hypothetical protein